jgi:hypothetical protein
MMDKNSLSVIPKYSRYIKRENKKAVKKPFINVEVLK